MDDETIRPVAFPRPSSELTRMIAEAMRAIERARLPAVHDGTIATASSALTLERFDAAVARLRRARLGSVVHGAEHPRQGEGGQHEGDGQERALDRVAGQGLQH